MDREAVSRVLLSYVSNISVLHSRLKLANCSYHDPDNPGTKGWHKSSPSVVLLVLEQRKGGLVKL